MYDECYLVVGRHGISGMTKRPPSLKANTIAVKVNVEFPNELFSRPTVSASIKIDPAAVPPVEIDAGTLEAISENIRTGLGVDVSLSVISTDVDEKPVKEII